MLQKILFTVNPICSNVLLLTISLKHCDISLRLYFPPLLPGQFWFYWLTMRQMWVSTDSHLQTLQTQVNSIFFCLLCFFSLCDFRVHFCSPGLDALQGKERGKKKKEKKSEQEKGHKKKKKSWGRNKLFKLKKSPNILDLMVFSNTKNAKFTILYTYRNVTQTVLKDILSS